MVIHVRILAVMQWHVVYVDQPDADLHPQQTCRFLLRVGRQFAGMTANEGCSDLVTVHTCKARADAADCSAGTYFSHSANCQRSHLTISSEGEVHLELDMAAEGHPIMERALLQEIHHGLIAPREVAKGHCASAPHQLHQMRHHL